MTDQRHSVGPYELRADDNIAFNRVAKGGLIDLTLGCSISIFAVVGFMGLSSLVCILVLAQFMSADEFRRYIPELPIAIWVASGVLALWLLLGVFNPLVLTRSFQRQALGKRKRTVVISPEQIETVTGAMTSMFPWSEVERVAVTGTHVFLFLSSISAIIVPARSFSTADAAKRFGDDARAWHAAAGGRA